MSILGSIAKSVAKAVSNYARNRSSGSSSSSSSGGSSSRSSGSSGRTSVGGYSHNYEYDSQGRIYKNGNLVDPGNYKYIPSNVVSAANKAASQSSGRTSQTIGSHTYSYDGSGNIYKNGSLVDPKNYKYIPSSVVDAANRPKTTSTGNTDTLAGLGNLMNAGANWLVNVLNNATQTPYPVLEYPVIPEMPYQQDLSAIIGQLQDMASQAYDSGSAALINQAYEETLAQIDAAQAALVSQMNEQMSGVDPATLAALQQIRDSVELNRRNLMEEMSQRGLLQSGIWLEEENRLANSQLNAEQSLLATRLQDLQAQLNQALANFGTMRVNAASNKSAQELQALQAEADRKSQALQQGLASAIDLYNANRNYALNEWSAKAPYYLETVDEMRDNDRADADLYGETPNYAGDPYRSQSANNAVSPNLVSVREYVGNRGKVNWDKNTQTVTVNGQKIEVNPDNIIGGRAYISKDVLDRILGGY